MTQSANYQRWGAPVHDGLPRGSRPPDPVFAVWFAARKGDCERLLSLGKPAVDLLIDALRSDAGGLQRRFLGGHRLEDQEPRHGLQVHRVQPESLEKEIAAMLSEAAAWDGEEDARYGKGRRGDGLPEDLRHRQGRLKRLGECQAKLKAERGAGHQVREEKIRRREAEEAETGRRKRQQSQKRWRNGPPGGRNLPNRQRKKHPASSRPPAGARTRGRAGRSRRLAPAAALPRWHRPRFAGTG